MSEYTRITDRKIELTDEGVEELMSTSEHSDDIEVSKDTQDDAMAKHWDEAQQNLYDWMDETAKEWYDMGVVNDKQYIALMMLLHEVDKKVYYDLRRDSD